jgi:hypothetical protein
MAALPVIEESRENMSKSHTILRRTFSKWKYWEETALSSVQIGFPRAKYDRFTAVTIYRLGVSGFGSCFRMCQSAKLVPILRKSRLLQSMKIPSL